jgi:uncharacterized protein (DUF1800 family)
MTATDARPRTANDVDPQWAWAAFEPDPEHPWNSTRAAHLFRRAGFAGNWTELDRAVQESPATVVQRLLDGPENADAARAESERFAETLLATGNPEQLSAWWVYEMLRTEHPLLEKMTLFWHGHFATSGDKVQDANLLFQQNQVLRLNALGDFSTLVHQVARDPAMLIYLDSATNRKAHPNENFARELMELFCLGEGNYSERDVQELARCFTGWEIRRGRFRFNRYQHDSGEKNILGSTGDFPDGTAIDLVLEQPAAARFIVSKLVRFFVFDEPEPGDRLLEPLAVLLRENAWNLRPVLECMLSSNLFFSEVALGRKIRSPVDLAVGFLRVLEGSTNAHDLARDLQGLGQGLFYPPNVKGWEGGRSWINSSTMLDRANLIGRLLRDPKTRFGGGNLAACFEAQGLTEPEAIVDRCEQLMLAVSGLPAATRKQLVRTAELGAGSLSERIAGMLHAMSTLPEFQLG